MLHNSCVLYIFISKQFCIPRASYMSVNSCRLFINEYGTGLSKDLLKNWCQNDNASEVCVSLSQQQLYGSLCLTLDMFLHQLSISRPFDSCVISQLGVKISTCVYLIRYLEDTYIIPAFYIFTSKQFCIPRISNGSAYKRIRFMFVKSMPTNWC